MVEHHGSVETAIPHFRRAVASGFQSKVVLHAFVAALGGSSGVVLQFPFLRNPGRDVDEPGVVLPGKVDGAAPLGVRTGVGTGADFGAAIHQRAAELGAVLGKFHTVMAHFKAGHTDGHTVRTNGKIIFVFELNAPFIIERNEGHDALPAAVFVDGHSVVDEIKEQLGDFAVR